MSTLLQADGVTGGLHAGRVAARREHERGGIASARRGHCAGHRTPHRAAPRAHLASPAVIVRVGAFGLAVAGEAPEAHLAVAGEFALARRVRMNIRRADTEGGLAARKEVIDRPGCRRCDAARHESARGGGAQLAGLAAAADGRSLRLAAGLSWAPVDSRDRREGSECDR